MNGTDAELLECFARDDSQAAFAELVTRHLDLVYTAARRQVGSPQLAEEVAQSVFLALVRQARRGSLDAPLGPWLYVVTRRTAVDAIRRESRQRARERAAAELSVMNAPDNSPWPRIEPILDEAMAALPAPDRSALVLRFFENKSLREVGAALGSSEDAAQKRVSRALEELRAFFARRGVTVPRAALGAELAASAVGAAPLGLGGTIVTAATTSVAAGVGTLIFAMTTIQKTVVAAVLIVALGAAVYQMRQTSLSRERVAVLEKEALAARIREQTLRNERNALQQRPVPVVAAAISATAANPVAGDELERVKQLRATMPERWIPELSFFTNEDWLQSFERDPWETEHQRREALASLRATGKIKFAARFQAAAKAYAATGQLPGEPSQLLPYFDPPIDAAILQRYDIVSPPGMTEAFNLVERAQALVDDEFETQIWIASVKDVAPGWSLKGGNGRTTKAFNAALAGFRAAGNGSYPGAFELLAPYLDATADPLLARELFRLFQEPRAGKTHSAEETPH
jgi:RNA polymerase sigma factor (sigma-70 family)